MPAAGPMSAQLALELRTGCRLHFGLIELSPRQPRCYGGLGMMLAEPSFELRFSQNPGAAGLSIRGPRNQAASNQAADEHGEVSRRLMDVVARRKRTHPGHPLPGKIEVLSTLPLHSGLGAGTQLASAAAMALEIFEKQIKAPEQGTNWRPVSDWLPALGDSQDAAASRLADWSGRGLRSSVGLSGFFGGGLILDVGRGESILAGEDAAAAQPSRPIATHRCELPPEWRVVLALPQSSNRVSGQEEARRLATIGRQPNPKREPMWQLAQELVLNSDVHRDFERFADSLEQYMAWAGEMFAQDQGGYFNGTSVASTARLARQLGLRAVGQSSWGPTVFGFCDNATSARQLAKQLTERSDVPLQSVTITRSDHGGARFRWREVS